MFLYVSPVVRETDSIFKPVADLLRRVRHELVSETVVKDIHMMFGQAKFRIYKYIDSLDVPVVLPPDRELFFPMSKR